MVYVGFPNSDWNSIKVYSILVDLKWHTKKKKKKSTQKEIEIRVLRREENFIEGIIKASVNSSHRNALHGLKLKKVLQIWHSNF